MSKHTFPEWLALLREQGYKVRQKPDGGYHITGPPGVNPEYRAFSISDPKEIGHAEKTLRNLLKRAGVRFPEEYPQVRNEKAAPVIEIKPQPQLTDDADPFEALRKKIEKMFDIASGMQNTATQMLDDLAKIKSAPPDPQVMAEYLTKKLFATK